MRLAMRGYSVGCLVALVLLVSTGCAPVPYNPSGLGQEDLVSIRNGSPWPFVVQVVAVNGEWAPGFSNPSKVKHFTHLEPGTHRIRWSQSHLADYYQSGSLLIKLEAGRRYLIGNRERDDPDGVVVWEEESGQVVSQFLWISRD